MNKIRTYLAALLLSTSLLSTVNAQVSTFKVSQGGTGNSSSTNGELLVGSSTCTSVSCKYFRLPVGSLGSVLQVSNAYPFVKWAATSTLGISGSSGWTFSSSTIWQLFSNTATGLNYDNTTGITSLVAGYVIPLAASTTQWAAAYASTTALTPSYLRGLFSNSATGLTYNSSTGDTSLTAGYTIPLTASTTEWKTAYASTTNMTPSYTRGLFSATYPITYNSSTGGISTAFSTSSVNVFSAANTFNAQLNFANASGTAVTATHYGDVYPTGITNTFIAVNPAGKIIATTTPGGTTYTGTYPIIVSGSVISSGFSTSTVNSYSAQQTFVTASATTAFTSPTLYFTNASSTGGVTTGSIFANIFPSGLSNSFLAVDTTGKIIATGTSQFYLASNPSGYITNSVSNLTNYPTYTYASSTFASTSWVTATFAPKASPTFTGSSTFVDILINGALFDSLSSRGSNGQVLLSTGTSTKWVATSSLGISGSLSGGTTGWLSYWTSPTTLSAVATGTAGQILIASSTSSSGYGWVSTSSLGIGGSGTTTYIGNTAWTIGNGEIHNATTTDNVGIGTTTPTQLLTIGAGNIFSINEWGTTASFASIKPAGGITSGDKSILLWYPRKAAFRAGEWVRQVDDSDIGDDGSVAFGYDTVASGQSSFAAGENSTSSGYGSFAVGVNNKATANGAIVFGTGNTAAGTNSFAGGDTSSRASGVASIAFGTGAIAAGDGGVAFGSFNTASGTDSFAQGKFNIAGTAPSTGYYSVSLGGQSNTVLDDYSVNLGGHNNVVSGINAVSIGGQWNTVSGGDSFTAGNYVNSTSTGSITLGYGINVANRLLSNINNSLFVGFNSNLPTFVVTQASGVGTIGKVGIGTTTPTQELSVAGGLQLTGQFRDGANASGTQGMVLQTTGTSTRWVATSSLGITGGTNSIFSTTSINGLATTTFVFSTSSDTNIGISIATTTSGVSFIPSWIGTLADGRIASSAAWNAAAASTTALTPSYIRNLFSNTTTGLTYAAATGITSLTSGYVIPLIASTTEWATAYASTTALTPSYIRGLFSNSATGLTYNSGTGATSLTAGYVIPLSASTTEWSGFYTTPSTRITAGNYLSWSGNTINGFFATTSINGLATTTFTFSTSSTGADFSISTTTSGVQFNTPSASASNRGFLTASDWTTFSNKLGQAFNIASGSALTIGNLYSTSTFNFLNASGTGLTATNLYGNVYPTGLTNSFIAVDTAGKIIATTTPGGTTYTGTYPIIVSGSVISSGFSTSTINSYSAQQTFVNASATTAFTAAKLFFTNASGTAITATHYGDMYPTGLSNSFIAVDTTGKIIATSTPAGALSGGTTGKVATWSSASTLTSGLFADNGTVAGVNATSSTVLFNVKGPSGNTKSLINVASSSNANVFSIASDGSLTSQPASTSTTAFVINNPSAQSVFSVNTTPASLTSFLFNVGTSSPANDYFFGVQGNGHLAASSTAPTLSSCGTSPTIRGNDTAGEITTGTTATGCTVTFSSAYTNAPSCVVTWQAVLATMSYTISTTAITITQTSTSNNKINYHCIGIGE